MMNAPENALTKTEGYTLLPDGRGDLKMICGGDVTIYFRTLLPVPEIIAEFEKAENAPRDSWFCIETDENGAIFLSENSAECKAKRLAKPYYDAEAKCLTYPMNPYGVVYIFGGGHVGRALVKTLSQLSFECVVYDDREEYASHEMHPAAVRTICDKYTAIGEHITFNAEDYVIVVTHGHSYDYDALLQTIASPAKYVGCMGSRRKTAVIRERLKNEAGVSDADIERLHAPIGLKIGAETPEELAISIAAELILIRSMG